MADLPEIGEELLGVLPAEQLRHLRVLQAPGPHTQRHGQRLVGSAGHTRRERLLFERTANTSDGNTAYKII